MESHRCIGEVTRDSLFFYQILSHLPALISQREMKSRIGFQARPGQVLLIGYTRKKYYLSKLKGYQVLERMKNFFPIVFSPWICIHESKC